MFKRRVNIILIVLVFGILGCAHAIKSGSTPTAMVDPQKVKLDKKGKVVIKGEGFKPGQEVNLLFTSTDGVTSDINYALKPKPVADNSGKWMTTWSCGRYVSKKLIKKGKFTFTVTDKDYNVITNTTAEFY